MPMLKPPHPGEILREECLAALALSVSDGARVLGVEPHFLQSIVDGSSDISPETAVRLEKAFGPSADMWLRLQMAFDLAEVRRREGDIKVMRYKPAGNRPPKTEAAE